MNLEEAFQSYTPRQDYVAIKRVPPELRSKSGLLHIPASAAEHARPFEGIVVAIGPGRVNGKGILSSPPPELKKGAHVFFGRYAGAEGALESDDFWMVRWDLIDAILEPSPVP